MVNTYLLKGNSRLGMPDERVDEVGTVYTGSVLQGKKSVEERRMEEVIAVLRSQRGRAECYVDVDDYDPVLKFHCRL